MRAIITGPTGTLGTALCRVLTGAGHEVIAVVRPGSRRAAAAAGIPGVRVIPCDLNRLSDLKEAGLPHCDWFFHLGWAGTFGPDRQNARLQDENIEAALTAVDLAAVLGCQSFVFAGSQAEYGRFEGALRGDTPCRPETGYGVAKLCAGQLTRLLCQNYGIRHIHCRILSLYGPGDGENTMISAAIRAFLQGEAGAFTAGEQLWDYLYSEDAARAMALMAEKGKDSAIYPLGSGTGRPLRDYILTIRDLIDPALCPGLGAVPYGQNQVMHLVADISDLQRDTDFQPQVDFAEGIRRTIAFWKEKEA